jgi:hypothetical protein
VQALEVDSLCEAMLLAAEHSLQKQWPKVRGVAGAQFRQIAEAVASVEQRRLSGTIDEEVARMELEMLRNASEATLAEVKGMSTLAAEAAINAALDAIKSTVNKALGFGLL